MKKICIVGCYFGKFRKDFNLWLNSCKYNSTIDYLIFSDCNSDYNLPCNVKIKKITFDELHKLVNEKLEMEVVLPRPYKLCDYKPMYGKIFEDYLKEYDFWGYCDFDMLFGDVRKFLTDELLEKNDRIYFLGHLCLYRNIPSVTLLFKSMPDQYDYKLICKDKRINIFDEIGGMYQICKAERINTYYNIDYADISKFNKRLKLEIHKLGTNNLNLANYKKQLFVWDSGQLYFYYIENEEIKSKELIYIHFSGRVYNAKNVSRFIIDKNEIIDLKEEKISKEHFEKYNKCYISFCEKILYILRTYLSRIKNHSNYNRMWDI